MTDYSSCSASGASLSPDQQRLNIANVARLQHQRAFGNEKPPRREAPSLFDLVGTPAKTSQSNFVLRRIL